MSTSSSLPEQGILVVFHSDMCQGARSLEGGVAGGREEEREGGREGGRQEQRAEEEEGRGH